jgi:hypothetical protein
VADERYQAPWQYRAYAANLPAIQFGPLASFVDMWRAKCPSSGVFPTWRDFDLMDFKGWWGQVSLAEMHDDPFDLRWVLWGTKITDWWGVDYTNKFISEIPAVHDVWEYQERDYLRRLVAERLIGFVVGSLSPQARNFYHICGVDLPLEKDGVITHVMSAYLLHDPSDGFVPPVAPVFEV